MAVADRLRLLALLGVLAWLVLGGRTVHAGPPSGSANRSQAGASDPNHERMRLVWRPASVAWPLSPIGGEPDQQRLSARLDQREAMLAGRAPAPSVRGVIEIDRERAAAVWIAALETVRVRQISGTAPLRFVRGIDGHAAVLEPGHPVAPGPGGERRWELQQPPSNGAVWSIEADEPTRVLIERVEARPPYYVAVELEQELLRWIAAARPDDEMPSLLEPSGELGDRLRLDAALGRELLRIGGRDARLEQAIEAWRMLGAMQAIDRQRPTVRPYFARQARAGPLPLEHTRATRLNVSDSRNYRLAEQPQRWTIDRKGPGQLRIAARSWAPIGQPLPAAELRVWVGGRVIERLSLSPRQARRASDPDAALPQLELLMTKAGEPVGELVERTIVLAPGRHAIEIELVGGGALLAIEAARRIESTSAAFRGWTPRRRMHAAERALQRSDSVAGPYLQLLLAERSQQPATLAIGEPRLFELGQQSPLLASWCLLIAAESAPLEPESLDWLIERIEPWLAALDRDHTIEPGVRGLVRARWLELLALHNRAELAQLLFERSAKNDPIAELPIAGLRTLADLLGPTRATVRSRELALLELARRRAPADEQLRNQMLLAWSAHSRWSRRQPLPPDADPLADPLANPLANIDTELRPIGEWLLARESAPVDAIDRANTWLRLEPGAPVRVLAELPSTTELPATAHRMRLLDVHVATPPQSREPVRLRVDQAHWWSPQLFAVQRHRVAVGPGVHELELDAPAGTIAWVGAPAADSHTHAQLGRRERMWPLARSVWRLPGPAVPGFVRLELRWPEDLPPQPVRIRVVENEDERGRVILFDPRTAASASDDRIAPAIEIDPEALPIDGSARATIRHDIVLPIAATTTQLRFEIADELPIAAALSLRRGPQVTDFEVREAMHEHATDPARSDDALFDTLAGLDRAALLSELTALSRRLLDSPDDLGPRARRAALLLMLGETGHARADLVRLAEYAQRDGVLDLRRERALELLDQVEQRFEALTDPREITVADTDRVTTPMLIEPAIAAVVSEDRSAIEPWLDLWATVRALPLDAALERLAREPAPDPSHLLAPLTRAHLLASDPLRAREAARAWLSLYGRLPGTLGHVREPVAVGLASVRPLLTHLDDPQSDARDAGLAFGLARALEPVYGHASVRRLAFVAALRSAWIRLDHSENNAGFERLELPTVEQRPTPTSEVRNALLAAPWPEREAELLSPGRKGVLAWDAAPGSVIVQLWCRAARPDLAPARATQADLGTAQLHLRVRSSGRRDAAIIEQELELRDAELGRFELPIARKGRHQLEVTLADDPVWLCSWRSEAAPSERAPARIETHRRAMWWTADSRRGVELTVLGPATLELELRSVVNTEPSAVIATVERLDVQGPLAAELPRLDGGQLPLARDVEPTIITERRRQFEVSHASTHALLLTEPVPHRIRVTTDRGRALVRARMRHERDDLPPPTRVSIRQLRVTHEQPAEPLMIRELGPELATIAGDPPAAIRNRIGTLDVRATFGLDQIGELDDLRPRLGLFASVGWRRALIDETLWLGLAAQTRLREQTSPTGGGLLWLSARIPKIDVRTGAELDVLAQAFAGRAETSVRVYGFIDRPTWLGPHVQLLPGLTLGWRWQSLTPERVAAANSSLEPHPRIHQRYIHEHPLLLQPELELRVYPFSDMALWTEAQLIPNSNMQSLDHLNFEIGTAGIARRPRPWVPSWGASYQASPRFADRNRAQFFVRHRLETELGFGLWARDNARFAFGVTNQLFFSNVAPVRNVIELWLRIDASFGRRMRDHGPREQWFREPWAPRAWGDDQHQAGSTVAPYGG